MARIASQAKAGFYATPTHLLEQISRLVSLQWPTDLDGHHKGNHAVLDPCAGEGEALATLKKHWFDPVLIAHEKRRTDASVSRWLSSPEMTLYAIEMDQSRFERARQNCDYSRTLHADAFRVDIIPDHGCTVLYLNPPYDQDSECKRLEERFLVRFTPALATDGALLFVVPFYALLASADTLARHYDQVQCYRFPDPDFGVFKQVVLVARRAISLKTPREGVRNAVLQWASSIEGMPSISDCAKPLLVQPLKERSYAFETFEAQQLDAMQLRADYRPWYLTNRSGALQSISGVIPDGLDPRLFPCAVPPRPAHIAAGIAAGVFDGARISPDDSSVGLPDLLIKGVFDREYQEVDRKVNADGDVTGIVRVQVPRLAITVLDLSASEYHQIKASTDPSGSKRISELTTGDLLLYYGKSLLKTLLDHCPVMHDPKRPGDAFAIQPVARELFTAQNNAVQAVVRLLGGNGVPKHKRKGRAAIVLGEIGVGKSSVACATAKAIGAHKTLILCPPHLLDSWRDQCKAVIPEFRTVVISEIKDVDAIAREAFPTEGLLATHKPNAPIVAILSREAAKLGHAWIGVGSRCPECGALQEEEADAQARRRLKCSSTTTRPANAWAWWSERLAWILASNGYRSELISDALKAMCSRNRTVQRLLVSELIVDPELSEEQKKERIEEKRIALKAKQSQLPQSKELHAFAWTIARAMARTDNSNVANTLLVVLALVLRTCVNPDLVGKIATWFYMGAAWDDATYGTAEQFRSIARKFLLYPFMTESRERLIKQFKAIEAATMGKSALETTETHWKYWQDELEGTLQGKYGWSTQNIVGPVSGDKPPIVKALENLYGPALWEESAPCRGPLYQAIPQPKRVPIASYIAKRRPKLFDLLILDEAHEYSGDGSAQSIAAARLTALGLPTVLLTGSVMNGYAESLFNNLWSVSLAFRAEFDRDQRADFVTRYGYRKQLVQELDPKTKKPIEYGSQSDRIESVKDHGNAPGVLPVLILKHLLPIAVTLQKEDLDLDLPPLAEHVELVTPGDDLLKEHKRLQDSLVTRIKSDRFQKGKAGKLWGQMSELPSHLDRATQDVGNNPSGTYRIHYPPTPDKELEIVAESEGFPKEHTLAKEQWMLDKVKAELAEDRSVMVLSWHVELLPRLQRIVESLGIKAPILYADKVDPKKRQTWIDRQVLKPKHRVLLTNPVCIQTGLNNLVWFSSQIWMENPACNPIVYRQAVGRIFRIGQTKPTRVFMPIYDGTSQTQAHRLLLSKVAISMATDGLDAVSAFNAAGAGSQDGMAAMSVGQQLYKLLTGDHA